MRLRSAQLGGILLALFALLLGCSGQGVSGISAPTPTDPAAVIRKLTETTRAAGTFRYETSTTATAPNGLTVPIKVTGAYDYSKNLSEAQVEGFGPPMRLVTDGKVAYLQPPGQSRWLRSDLTEMVGTNTDVAKQLDFLNVIQGVREVGSAEVRGVQTRHFEGTLDMQQVATAMGLGPGELPLGAAEVDLYLDSDDLLRRMEITLPSDGEVSGTSTTDYFDYGAEVNITVPDPSQVDEFTLPNFGG